jgi:hypothetical protein
MNKRAPMAAAHRRGSLERRWAKGERGGGQPLALGRRRRTPAAMRGSGARGELEPEGTSSEGSGAAPTLGLAREGGVAAGERRCGGRQLKWGWWRCREEGGGGGPMRTRIGVGFSLDGPFIRTQFGKK